MFEKVREETQREMENDRTDFSNKTALTVLIKIKFKIHFSLIWTLSL